MKILIVAATAFELAPFQEFLEVNADALFEKELHFECLVTGVGVVSTSYHLTKYLSQNDVAAAIQVGIAGSFREAYMVGTVVQVVSEAIADLGAEDSGGFLDLFDLNLLGNNDMPFDNKLLFAPESLPQELMFKLPKVHGITVSTTSGAESTIRYRRKRFAADIETMEGAAFHYICIMEQIPFIQIRGISNPITKRDTSQWHIQKAVLAANKVLMQHFL